MSLIAWSLRLWRKAAAWNTRRRTQKLEALVLREMPELTRVPWGFSFMGTGTENTATNVTLCDPYSGPQQS